MFYICIDRVYVPRPLRKTTPCDGLPYPKLAAELPKSTMSAKPQAHATKWTVVVGLDRPTVRLFSDQAKAETERDFLVQHGRQAYLWKAASALGSHALRKPIRYRGSCARAADIHSRDGPPALCG